jgi:ammonium transporter Rh
MLFLFIYPRFIGFGYLMTFIKSYGLGAVGFTMLVTALGLQWYVLCESFFHQIYGHNRTQAWQYADITIYSLMNALFGVSAVLISFGAVIGKIKPFQLVLMAFVELVLHAFNFEVILSGGLQVADVGGTYADHMFGCYFGLAVSFVLGRYAQQQHRHSPPHDPPTGYVADLFSFVGTLFLWLYWPSFVAGGAVADSVEQQRAVVNTILSLSSSTLCAFYLSSDCNNNHRKSFVFRPVDIQNATLAGGVAIGCIANLNLNPVNAILVGCAAGLVSTFGFNRIQPWLVQRVGLHDSCGIHNLHGMPSLLGAIASICLAAYKQTGGRKHDGAVYGTQHGNQAWRQFVGALLTLCCALVGGAVTGWLLTAVDGEPMSVLYDDRKAWEAAEDCPVAEEHFQLPLSGSDGGSLSGKGLDDEVEVGEEVEGLGDVEMRKAIH